MFEIRHENMGDSQATQNAYNEIYEGHGILLRDTFYQLLLRLLNPEPGKILLDISTGQGRLITLSKEWKVKGIGLDFAMSGVTIGKSQYPDADWVIGDGEQLPIASRSINYVTHIGSLEHYISPALGAREIARVLTLDGSACILLPNAFGLLGNVLHVGRTGEIFDDGQPLQRYGTIQTWSKLLENNGLVIDKVIGYGELEKPQKLSHWRWYIKRPIKFVRLVTTMFIPLNFANHFIFLCHSKSFAE